MIKFPRLHPRPMRGGKAPMPFKYTIPGSQLVVNSQFSMWAAKEFNAMAKPMT